MPFGLSNAPATFEHMMDSLLRSFKWSVCLCYLDDFIVFPTAFENHLARLSTVLDVLRCACVQLNSLKCCFEHRQIVVLGDLTDAAGVQPDPDKALLRGRPRTFAIFLASMLVLPPFCPEFRGSSPPFHWPTQGRCHFRLQL